MRTLTVLLSLVIPLAAQTLDQVRKDFANPPKSARPMVRWWWPGGDVEPAELKREIGILDDAWFGGAEIQPFLVNLKRDVPPDVRERVNDYPTVSFYTKVRAAVEEARQRGMVIDLTLGSGWPFGGGDAVTPELASLELAGTFQSLHGPTTLREKLVLPPGPPSFSQMISKMFGTPPDLPTGWKQRLDSRKKNIAVVAVRGTSPQTQEVGGGLLGAKRLTVSKPGELDSASAVVLTSRLQADGSLNWDVPAGDWQIFLFEQHATGDLIIGGAGKGPQLVLDHMNRKALEAHLNRVAGPAAEPVRAFFGSTVRAGFCDSLEVQANLYWSDSFLDEFKRRRGYDLTPWLPFLKQPGKADPYDSYSSAPLFEGKGAEKARQDYWRTVSDLWIDNFFQPLREWNHGQKLQARAQVYGAPVDVMQAWSLADIPETEQLYAGGGIDFLKAASSAGHVYGKKVISSESFVHMGKAYQSTPESLMRDTNRLIASGINQAIYHGFPYVYMDRPEPGWHPFAAPIPFSDHFNPHNTKIWSEVPKLNRYLTRLQYISQNGKPVVTNLVYRPVLDYPATNSALDPVTRDFDYINETEVQRCKVRGGRIVTPSGMEYDTLVLPAGEGKLREKFKGAKVVTGPLASDDAPTRWKLGGAEFQFHYNASETEKTVPVAAGSYEAWDPSTGDTAPWAGSTLTLGPDATKLLVKVR